MTANGNLVRLEIQSSFDMLDFVQLVCDHVGEMAGFDEDSLHWIGVAVRESVINAIKHGNHFDVSKRVEVDFTMRPAAAPAELFVRVRDHGEGFDPGALPDPLAPENLLKANGRGIFFMRSFMDDVRIERASGGGMEVRMLKRLNRT